MDKVSINSEQELYVIPCGTGKNAGFTCLGFDVCLRRSQEYALWLGIRELSLDRGTLGAYEQYRSLVEQVRLKVEKTGVKCPAELTPQLIGLEGKRVEVLDAHGERRRFIVGKSTGWIPCHLELANRRSTGGGSVTGAPFKSVTVLR